MQLVGSMLRTALVTVQINWPKSLLSSQLTHNYSYPYHYPLLPPPLPIKLLVPDHSLHIAGREWSGTEIVILSERLQYLVTRRRG